MWVCIFVGMYVACTYALARACGDRNGVRVGLWSRDHRLAPENGSGCFGIDCKSHTGRKFKFKLSIL